MDIFHDKACALLKSSLYIAREALHINVKHSPCYGKGRDSFTCLFPQGSPLSHPQATCGPPSLGMGWLGQESVHAPGAVSDSSGGLRGRGMYTKLPLPLLWIFMGAFERSPSQAIAGLSHLSLLPGMGVAPICAQSQGITGPLATPSRSQGPPLAP